MSQTTPSPEEIERTAEKERSDIRETAEEIRHRLSPESLVDSGLDYMRERGGSRLLAAIYQNPLAAVLAGIGIGGLFYTMQRQGRQHGSRPGMMGDGTKEQNLGQVGNPGARITKDEVEDAFRNKDRAKGI